MSPSSPPRHSESSIPPPPILTSICEPPAPPAQRSARSSRAASTRCVRSPAPPTPVRSLPTVRSSRYTVYLLTPLVPAQLRVVTWRKSVSAPDNADACFARIADDGTPRGGARKRCAPPRPPPPPSSPRCPSRTVYLSLHLTASRTHAHPPAAARAAPPATPRPGVRAPLRVVTWPLEARQRANADARIPAPALASRIPRARA
ncbi:hypothetical protein B0H15DRAFT_957142 [Mycena belliarum]|uniref:Uncharacterized protein n=1 Tax=Mycena belliarum TaxID=1033014 RepID=A0AAD6TRH8_9AGAR|nr:hypothetical protein B0H15DRAFT_957142 [Mycena belliae]